MSKSVAARLLAALPLNACRWPSDHDPFDERFRWCGHRVLEVDPENETVG
jgi:hypothetical protein